eukprot:scaffold2866_cov148-Isochrysis_galbana.AAC.11
MDHGLHTMTCDTRPAATARTRPYKPAVHAVVHRSPIQMPMPTPSTASRPTSCSWDDNRGAVLRMLISSMRAVVGPLLWTLFETTTYLAV